MLALSVETTTPSDQCDKEAAAHGQMAASTGQNSQVFLYPPEPRSPQRPDCLRESALYFPARRSNLSVLKEISPEYSLEGLMLKLKLQYFGHLIRRAD